MRRKGEHRVLSLFHIPVAFSTIATGCGTVPFPAAPKDLPAELRFVTENRSRFVEDPNDPLFELPPGTIVDDLSLLDGCWAAALPADVAVDGEPLLTLYFVYRFDAESGTFTSWIYQRDAFGRFFTLASGDSGTFVVEDGNRIVFTVQQTMGYDPETGEFLTAEPARDRFEELATLSGDRLRLHFGAADREPVDPGDDQVYTRFDCPASAASAGEGG